MVFLLSAVVVLLSRRLRGKHEDTLPEYHSPIQVGGWNSLKFSPGEHVSFAVPEGFSADLLVRSDCEFPVGVTASGKDTTFSWSLVPERVSRDKTSLQAKLHELVSPVSRFYELNEREIGEILEGRGMSWQGHDIRMKHGGLGFIEIGIFPLEDLTIQYRIHTENFDSPQYLAAKAAATNLKVDDENQPQ